MKLIILQAAIGAAFLILVISTISFIIIFISTLSLLPNKKKENFLKKTLILIVRIIIALIIAIIASFFIGYLSSLLFFPCTYC